MTEKQWNKKAEKQAKEYQELYGIDSVEMESIRHSAYENAMPKKYGFIYDVFTEETLSYFIGGIEGILIERYGNK